MKKILLGVSALMLSAVMSSQAQVLTEHFSYTSGTALTANGWTAHSAAGTNSMMVSASSLTYPEYSPSAVGGAAVCAGNGEDINKSFTYVDTGSVYVSFLLRVDTLGSAGYFFHLTDTGGTVSNFNYRGKLFLQTDALNANAYNIGLSVGSNTATYSTTSYLKGDTVLVVLKYSIITGASNNEASLFVFEPGTSIYSEPSPLVGPLTDATQSDIDPGRIALRQYTNNTDFIIDAIQVDTFWNLGGSPPPPPPVIIPTYDIATISTVDANGVADSLGVYCWTKGVVMGVDLDGNAGYSFTIWDNDGINVFSTVDVDGYVVTEGDSVMLLGSVAQYNGLTEFMPDSIVLVNQGNTIPTPAVVSSLGEAQESELVRIENFYVIDNPLNTGSFNVTLSNGTDTVIVRVDSDTDIPGNVTFNFGDTVCSIIGIGGQFDSSNPYTSGYQLFPQRASDIDNNCGSIPPAPIPFYPIADINNVDANGEPDSLGVYCWTKGVVLGIDLDGNGGYSFTLFDEEGINIYSSVDIGTYQVTEGDSLMVKGSILFYNGLTELTPDSIVVLNQGNAVPANKTVTSLGEETESAPIRVVNVMVINPSQWGTGSSSFNVDLVTCSGDTIQMRVDSDVDVADSIATAPTGMFTVTGIGGQFDNSSPYFSGYQIFPMSYMDIDTTTNYSAPALLINEIMSSNDSVIMDENGGYDDWAELYNAGTSDIILAGLFFTDDAAEPLKYQVPSNSTAVITAGGYALVWCDDESEQGDLHANFKLSASGEYFGVTSYDGCVSVDGIDFPALDANTSFGRITDGADSLVTFPAWSTTPNAMNMLDTVNSVGEIDYAANQLVVYPNPSNGNSMVRFNKNITFEVYDVLGNVVSTARNSRELNIANLRSGAYLIKTDNGEVIRMIVK